MNRDRQHPAVTPMLAVISGLGAFALALILDFDMTFAIVVAVGAFLMSLLLSMLGARHSE